MLNHKKKISKIKTENLLKEFPLIFLLQQNNLTLKEWFDLKQQIQELNQKSSSSCKILTIKNTILRKRLQTFDSSNLFPKNFQPLETNQEIINSMLQGPCFLLGCHKETVLEPLWNYVQSNPKLVFICCFYKNQILNHLDFQVFLKTTPSIYQKFLQQVDKKTELYTTLQYHLKFQFLGNLQHNFLSTLKSIK